MSFEPLEAVRSVKLGNRDSAMLVNLDPVLPGNVAAGFEEYPEVEDLIGFLKSSNPNVRTISATTIAEKAGKAVAANAVMIGAVAAMPGFPLDKELLKKVLLERVPPKTVELNSKAFEMGYDAMRSDS